MLSCANCGFKFAGNIGTRVTPPSVQEILGSNRVPSEADARSIRRAILEAQKDLLKLDLEIARVQVVIDQLSQDRSALDSYLMDHRALLSPARRMPPEVVTEIFMRCLEDGSDPHSSSSKNRIPLLLSQICRAWRSVALSTPRLWSSLATTFTESNQMSKAALTEIWLSRSGACPLTLSMLSSEDVFNQIVMDMIIPYSRRWKSVDLRLPKSVLGLLNKLPKDSLPLLESLTLRFSPENRHISERRQRITIFESAPRLRRVTLESTLSSLWITPTLPWSQLTHFTSTVPGAVRDFIHVMHRCINLEKCHITPSSMVENYIGPPIRLPSLWSLSTNGYLWNFLYNLTLPALRDFTFRYDAREYHPFWPHAPFESLLSQAWCPLERFSLINVAMDTREFIACLQLMPSLRELDVEVNANLNQYVTDYALARLTYRGTQHPCLLPNMQVIRIRGGFNFDSNMFVDMVQSRWNLDAHSAGHAEDPFMLWEPEIACIKVVEITLLPPFHQELPAIARLERLREEGLSVTMT